jgi:hypothetical protein
MPADAAIVLFPKYTTLVSNDSNETDFTTTPIDVSRFGSAQFQLWRGPVLGSATSFKAFLEESLDGDTWSTPPGGLAAGYDPGENASKMFSYAFRLRWFRLRVAFKGECVPLWAEGMLR